MLENIHVPRTQSKNTSLYDIYYTSSCFLCVLFTALLPNCFPSFLTPGVHAANSEWGKSERISSTLGLATSELHHQPYI